jgi:molecular chaperone GrpE
VTEERRVRVTDKRRSAKGAGPQARREPDPPAPEATGAEQKPDYLDDLRRLQAEFENYRKRMMKEQAALVDRATARLVERLLPALDNFERAIEHGEVSPGVELIYKELRAALEAEGLEEVPARGQDFDPRIHEAVGSVEADVDHEQVSDVQRAGYRFRGALLRPAMVVVARPRLSTDAGGDDAGGDDAGGDDAGGDEERTA